MLKEARRLRYCCAPGAGHRSPNACPWPRGEQPVSDGEMAGSVALHVQYNFLASPQMMAPILTRLENRDLPPLRRRHVLCPECLVDRRKDRIAAIALLGVARHPVTPPLAEAGSLVGKERKSVG